MSTGNRQERRTATLRSITRTARELLVSEGAHAIRIRAIARELGLTAPALYRYVDSHERLLELVVGEIYDDASSAIEQAARAASEDPLDRMSAASWAFRAWALEHPREFGLVFTNPIPDLGTGDLRPGSPQLRFATAFGDLFTDVWRRAPFPVPDPEQLAPDVVEQLDRHARVVLPDIPIGAVHTFVWCWARLYGAVCLEVFGHLSWAMPEGEPLFAALLEEIGAKIAPA